MWGALLTIAQKSFILIVAIVGVIDLLNFKDPSIVQYTIFDRRLDELEINFAETYGSFVFGF